MPGLSPATSTTAPAPSPNSTQVPRSFQSRMRENTSAPTTRAFFAILFLMKLSAVAMRVDETAAHRLHVERRAAGDAELRLQQAGGAREDVIRRRGRDDDQIDFRCIHAGGLERPLARFEREVAGCLLLVGDVAAGDAGALADPGVAGVQALGEIVVGHDARRQVAAGAGDARSEIIARAPASAPCAARSRYGTSLRTSSTARSSAWPKA